LNGLWVLIAANQPILLTNKDSLPAGVAAYLTANPGIATSDVIGGTGVISEAVKAMLPSATRHAGSTAYDTNNQVVQDFDSVLTYSDVYLGGLKTMNRALFRALFKQYRKKVATIYSADFRIT